MNNQLIVNPHIHTSAYCYHASADTGPARYRVTFRSTALNSSSIQLLLQYYLPAETLAYSLHAQPISFPACYATQRRREAVGVEEKEEVSRIGLLSPLCGQAREHPLH